MTRRWIYGGEKVDGYLVRVLVRERDLRSVPLPNVTEICYEVSRDEAEEKDEDEDEKKGELRVGYHSFEVGFCLEPDGGGGWEEFPGCVQFLLRQNVGRQEHDKTSCLRPSFVELAMYTLSPLFLLFLLSLLSSFLSSLLSLVSLRSSLFSLFSLSSPLYLLHPSFLFCY